MRVLVLAVPLLAALLLAPAAEASPVGYCTILKGGPSGGGCHAGLACVFTEDGTEVCVPDACGRTVCW